MSIHKVGGLQQLADPPTLQRRSCLNQDVSIRAHCGRPLNIGRDYGGSTLISIRTLPEPAVAAGAQTETIVVAERRLSFWQGLDRTVMRIRCSLLNIAIINLCINKDEVGTVGWLLCFDRFGKPSLSAQLSTAKLEVAV